MSHSSPAFPLRTCGVLAFLATAGIGWNLFSPAASQAAGESPVMPETRHAARPERAPRSVAAEAASRRMGTIRAAADPEARMLATLSLASSLDPADFAAWIDGGWFDMRGGPELMMFTKILMDRWKIEDPEGLLVWARKNGTGVGRELMHDWALREPQRLLAWFKEHRDDQSEVSVLATIAGHSPDLALQRLREMVENGMDENAMRNSRGLMRALADKSPAALEAMLGSLPPDLKLGAEIALSSKRMDASFSEEIRNLWDHPDGWRIFAGMERSPETTKKLMEELVDLPDEWRRLLVSSPYDYIGGENTVEWLKLDLAGAGFSPTQTKSLRGHALQNLAYKDPAATIAYLGTLEVEQQARQQILQAVFSNDPADPDKLLEQLPQEDQDRAKAMMGARKESETISAGSDTTPQELLEKILAVDPAHVGTGSYFPQLDSWDSGKLQSLTKGFGALPDEQKTRAAAFITANVEYSAAPMALQGAALRHLASQPDAGAAVGDDSNGFETLTAKVSSHAAALSIENPVEAASWVESLPAGEARTWAQRNVLKNWIQYDPQAAKAWEKSLSASDRKALAEIKR